MSDENKASDGLDQSVDGGIDKAMAAKGAYDAAQSIGSAAAEAGAAAAESAASAGASAGAATGTGAAVGTAAGPGGTALGAIIGLAVSLFAKPLFKAFILIALGIVMIFKSLPSMFFENTVDVADNGGPLSVYQQYKQYAMDAYGEELEKRKQEIEDEFQQRIDDGEFDDYDEVNFTYSFNPDEAVFLSQLEQASTLIIAMFDIQTDDWRKATFDDFKKAVNSVSFWNDTIIVSMEDEESETYQDGDDKIIDIHITYSIYDMGVQEFRKKFGLADEKLYLQAVEMAYNTKIYFGEVDDLPMGGVSGGSAGSFPGGGTHSSIRAAIAAMEEQPAFFGGSVIIPVASYHRISSEFGPRDYAPDPIHTGIDFSADAGTPIYAAMDGIVLARWTNYGSFGHHIVLYHGYDEERGGAITTMYAHMQSFGSYQVGERVRRGDTIGYVGRTGLSTGDHLHFEYQINGSAHNPRLILPL